MNLSLNDIIALKDRAIQSGTLDKWAEIAVEWMRAAERRVEELTKQRNAELDTASRLQFPDTTGG